jgi:toxin-antitoxin system PIN domain toxin
MIVDANILLYAVDETARQHGRAKAFLEEYLNGDVRIGIPWQSIAAFLRIATHPRVMSAPLTAAAAVTFVDDWLAAPATWLPDVTSRTWTILRDLVTTHGLTGNLIPDAHLAALAIEYGVPVASADSDFARFPEVRWVNPCGSGAPGAP